MNNGGLRAQGVWLAEGREAASCHLDENIALPRGLAGLRRGSRREMSSKGRGHSQGARVCHVAAAVACMSPASLPMGPDVAGDSGTIMGA